ncbi:MAG: hypothetical protein OXU20_20495 [Myxococcales bacterium]|nr:hypothetical protein [Myxococcales bacterium]
MSDPTFDPARVYVDLNEMVEPDVVLLAKGDERADSDGNVVRLREGLRVLIWSDDLDDAGNFDPLLGEGVVERNHYDAPWCQHVKWCCRLDGALRNRSAG